MNIEGIKYNKDGLIPAVIQDAGTGRVLMMAYMNEESLKLSLETGRTHFWSRSRNKLWLKGETSGHYQQIVESYMDCDKDTLLFKVNQIEAACHTGSYSCFYNKIDEKTGELTECGDTKTLQEGQGILYELYDVVTDRRDNPKEGSYTNYLFEKGLDKILKKVGEEAAEVIIAAKNREPSEVTYEVADLIYHLTVMLVEQGVDIDSIFDELKKRR